METTVITKDQERKALSQIREIIEALGSDSYVTTAFTGCFDLAEQNIEYDAALSMKYYETRCSEVEADNKRLLEFIEKEQDRSIKLLERIEKEQEWKPYDGNHNVKQDDYERLASSVPNGAYYMTDEEAKEWICSEFDFDRDKITILHEIDEYEINRHCQLRKTSRKIDRRPVYCATDYHCIRFNTSHWSYEVWNDTLRPFFD